MLRQGCIKRNVFSGSPSVAVPTGGEIGKDKEAGKDCIQ